MSQLVLKNILAGSGNVLAGGDNSGNVNKVTIGSNLTLSGGVLSAIGGGSGSVTSVAVSRSGNALSISGSPITSAGVINIGFAGSSTQYINGEGNLVTFPSFAQANKLITEVYNETGATLTKGTIVYINGGHGNLPTVTKAQANSDATSAQTYGVVQNDITNNNNGYVVVIGSLSDLDTQAYTNGTQLYLSGTTAGAWTSTKPSAPTHLVYVGIVTRSHPTQGVVEIKIQNGYELDELHDVSITTVANNDGIFYNSTSSLWENKTIAEVLGYTPANDANVVKLTGNQTIGGIKSFSAEAKFSTGITMNGGDFVIKSDTYNTSINSEVLTESRSILFPDNSGTVALLSDISYPVTSVFGRTGDVIAVDGDYDTDLVTEGSTNLYFTNARARGVLSTNTGSALTYNSTTGRFTLNAAESGINGYLTGDDWDYFDSKQASLGTGTTSQFLRGDLVWAAPAPISLDEISDVDYVGTPSTGQLLRYRIDHWENWTPTYVAAGFFSATAPLSYNSTTGVFSISQATTSTNGYLSSTDWNTFNNKQSALTNPVTGTGTTNTIPKFTGTSTIGNSSITDDGSSVTITSTTVPLLLKATSTTGYTDIGFINSNDTCRWYAGIGNQSETTYGVPNKFFIYDNNAAIMRFVIDTSGNFSLTTGATNAIGITRVAADTSYNLITLNNTAAEGQYIGIAGGGGGDKSLYVAAGNGGSVILRNGNGTTFAENLIVKSNGNILIGTTTDAGYKLDVNGTGRFSGSISFGNNNIFPTGAGIFQGSNYLQIVGGSSGFTINNNANTVVNFLLTNSGAATFSSSVTAAQLIVSAPTSTSYGSLNATTSGYAYQEYKYSGTSYGYIGQQSSFIGGSSNTDLGIVSVNNLIFGTGGSFTERMRITSGGNVGLGATSFPDGDKLLIEGSGIWNVTLGLNNTGTGGRKWNIFSTNNSFSQGAGKLLFYNSTGGTNAMVIDSSNNIGVGTTNPTEAKFVIQGAGTTESRVINTATTGQAAMWVRNNEINEAGVGIYGSSVSPYGAIGSGESFFYSTAALTLMCDNASGVIKFAPGGNTERLRITAGGNFIIGSTTDTGQKMQLSGGQFYIAGGQSGGSTAAYTSWNTITFGDQYNDVARGPNKIITYGRGSSWVAGIGIHSDTQAYYAGGTHKWYKFDGTTATLNLELSGTGALTAYGGFFESSDKRLKKELKDNPTSANIENIKPKLYIKNGKEELGYYAQDFLNILPSAVWEGSDGFLTLSYSQVHTAKIAKLELEVSELKQLVKDLIYELGRNSK